MATRARVALNGRFKPGTQVRLVRVRDERALRAEGGENVGSKAVDEDGHVEFTAGVQEGARYFIVGLVDGHPLEVRARGRAAGDEAELLEQPPVGNDRQRLADGSFLDEVPDRRPTPTAEVGPAPGQDQVPKGTVQRSDTPRGTAHPVDVAAAEPVRRQEDVNGPVQMSDTETGEATEIVTAPERQEDTPKGLLQRSDTPTGVATPIPSGDAVRAQEARESSLARESRGEPGKAAAVPLDHRQIPASQRPAKDRPADLAPPTGDQPADANVNTSGLDAHGQPAAADVAAAVGIEPAKAPAEPVNTPRKRPARKRAAKKKSKSTTASKSATPAAKKKEN